MSQFQEQPTVPVPLRICWSKFCLGGENARPPEDLLSLTSVRTHQLVDFKSRVVPLRPGAAVEVLAHLDGSLSALYGGHRGILRGNTENSET